MPPPRIAATPDREPMRIRVLGSAAGGGFPQWNCACANCHGVRTGTVRAVPRTQESVAIAGRDDAWVLLNASPDVRLQIERCPPLHPRPPRRSPLAAVVLTNGDLDHCLGLFSLREWHPLTVYATERVLRGLREGSAFVRTLERFPGQIVWRALAVGMPTRLVAGACDTGLVLEAVAVPGKPPLHAGPDAVRDPEDNVGLRIRDDDSGRVLAYFPSVGAIDGSLRRALGGADVVFFDGTFWSEHELTEAGIEGPPAAAMAHLPVGGPHGSLVALADLAVPRRLFIHLNNTQPLLRDDAPERAAVEARGWEVAVDGMELHL
jgi:pyrroloquinoline quinone biosynthesis protein B